jgi:hypothetical protein
MTDNLLRAFLESTGRPPLRDVPEEFIATLPVPSRRDGRKVLMGLWGVSIEGGRRFLSAACGIVYDVEQDAGHTVAMHRKLDAPVYPLGATKEALDEYGDLLDREFAAFFDSGQLPSAARWRELIVALLGPEVWKIYGDLAPDFVQALGPVPFVR